MARDLTVLADPVHGFIKIPQKIIQSLLESPEVQRLRRIKQLGMGSLVFPAAEHSRFPHALGAMGLLSGALDNLKAKGARIKKDERLAAMAAILLHDIGHSPFSHTLESKLIHDTKHEEISIALVKRLKSQMGGLLDMEIEMLEGNYEKPFFNALISSQLDMDRLDYLCRDSHFTGVAEGRIGVGRILRTLCVHPADGGSKSHLAIESKGVYAVENVLIARRLMYWQVYVHKTVIAADHALVGAIDRARDLIRNGDDDAVHGISPTLYWFLKENPDKSRVIEDQVLTRFLDLDDSEVIYSLKQW
ncbi:MAG: HD domain-containing protein, partial [Bacteroidetes bacterium]|nr:HD domain-containing protein [Bacteroidota bacterium]